jgi:hypothetical protein
MTCGLPIPQGKNCTKPVGHFGLCENVAPVDWFAAPAAPRPEGKKEFEKETVGFRSQEAAANPNVNPTVKTLLCPLCSEPLIQGQEWDYTPPPNPAPAHRHCIHMRRRCKDCGQWRDTEDRIRDWFCKHVTVIPPESDVARYVISRLDSSISQTETYRAYQKQCQDQAKIGLFFREHYQREIQRGEHKRFTEDVDAILFYLERERKVFGSLWGRILYRIGILR